jgi:hypothetical protein
MAGRWILYTNTDCYVSIGYCFVLLACPSAKKFNFVIALSGCRVGIKKPAMSYKSIIYKSVSSKSVNLFQYKTSIAGSRTSSMKSTRSKTVGLK